MGYYVQSTFSHMIQFHPPWVLLVELPTRGCRIRPRRRLMQQFRMPMHTRHHSQPYNSPNSLRDLPLINRPQPRLLAMLDPAHRGHIFTHDTEVLIVRHRVKAQHIENVTLWLGAFLPLRHLDVAEVFRRVNVAGFPAAGDLPRDVLAAAVFLEVFGGNVSWRFGVLAATQIGESCYSQRGGE